jgi:hypothetical protein
MSVFVHLIHLYVCAPWVHRVARLRVAPPRWLYPSESFHWWVHPYLSMYQDHPHLMWVLSAWRDVVMSMLSHDLLEICNLLLVRETRPQFHFDWLTSYPDCNHALNCASSPRRFSSQDMKTESVISLQSGKRTQLKYSCEIDGVLLEVRNRKGRCYAWILEATTKSPLNLELLLFPRYNRCNHCLIHAVFQHILATGTNSLAPTCLSSGWLCVWHHCVMSHP